MDICVLKVFTVNVSLEYKILLGGGGGITYS